jgi:hypothetical protein
MKRIASLVIGVLLCAGCKSSSPAYDPFLGRQTIPPPGTATPPPGQPYYGSPPSVSTGAPIAPPTGGTLPAPTGPTNFAPTPAGGNGFSSLSPNVSPVMPSTTPNPAPSAFGRPAFTPVSSPARPNYAPPGGAAYPQANSLAPAGMNTAQAGVPKPLDVDGIVGRASGQPTPAVMQAAQWQPSGASAKTNTATPASYTTTPNQSSVRVVEPAFTNRSAGSVPELGDLPPVNAQGMQPLSNARPITAGAAVAATSAAAAQRSPPAPTPATGRTVGISNYGYDPQYRWLKGKLEYSQSDRTWKLRYIPADEAGDQFGGSVKLGDAAKLNGFQNGDLVVTQGTVGNASSAAGQGSFAPLYNIVAIQKQ